jgi:tetratricopeptide (TPR) repeat protein
VTLQNSPTSLLRTLLVALLAAASLAATPDRFTKIPVEDPASVKQLRESIADLTNRLEKTPNDIPARIELASAYTQLAEFDSAERELTLATATAPDNAQAWAAFGDLKCARQHWQDAIESLTKAISRGDTQGETFLNLAIAYQRTEDQPRALEYYTKALEHGCDNALLHRGRLHGLMGNVDLATQDFDTAIEHNVDPAQAYLQRG